MTDSTTPDAKTEKTTPGLTIQQIEAEIEVTRIEMVHTVNALADRLHPKALAEHTSVAAKQATQDTATLIKGGGMPVGQSQSRNVKVLLGVAAATIVVVGLLIMRKK